MYEDVTYENLLARMLAQVPDKLDKRPSSVIYDTLSSTAIELQILYIELELSLLFVDVKTPFERFQGYEESLLIAHETQRAYSVKLLSITPLNVYCSVQFASKYHPPNI